MTTRIQIGQTITAGLNAGEVARLFAPIHQRIAALPDDPDGDKTGLNGLSIAKVWAWIR